MGSLELVAAGVGGGSLLSLDDSGGFLAAGSPPNSEVCIHDVRRRGLTDPIPAPHAVKIAGRVMQVALTRSGAHLAAACDNGMAVVYARDDTGKYQEIQKLRRYGFQTATGVALTQDFTHAAVAFLGKPGSEGAIVLYDAENGVMLERNGGELEQGGALGRVTLSAAADVLAFAVGTGKTATVKFVDYTASEPSVRTISAPSSLSPVFDLSKDGDTIIVAGTTEYKVFRRFNDGIINFEHRVDAQLGPIPFCATDGLVWAVGGVGNSFELVFGEETIEKTEKSGKTKSPGFEGVAVAVASDSENGFVTVAVSFRGGFVRVWRYG